MSESSDQDRRENAERVQLDVYGVKIKGQPTADRQEIPKTWRQVRAKLHQHLMTIAERILGFPADVLVGAGNAARGAGEFFLRRDAIEHQRAADAEEDARQATLEERPSEALPAPDVRDVNTDVSQKLEELRDLLNELRAQGLGVEIRDLGEGRMGICLAPPDQLEAIHDLVETKFLPQLEVDLASDADDLLRQPISDLDLSVRARRCMIELGVSTIGDLVQLNAGQLLAVKGFGQTTLDEVRQKLAAVVLTLSAG